MEFLQQSVRSVIEKGRIGSPVFLRCVVHVTAEKAPLLPSVAEVAALANSWMPSSPVRVYAQGNAEAAQVTVMIHYAAGQMALLNVNRVSAAPAVDIMLVGNKGVIYHETPIGRHSVNAIPSPIEGTFIDNGGVRVLTEAIVRSLESGRPVTLVED